MGNDIPDQQNQPSFINLICAYHEAYKLAARLTATRATLVLGTAILIPALGTVSNDLRPWGAFVSLIILMIDLVIFESRIKAHQELGACIQELFDIRLFHLSWPEVAAGPEPTPEHIVELAQAFRETHKPEKVESFRDWYPKNCAPLPLTLARIVCQRSNLQWDSALRRRFCRVHVVLILLMIAAAILFGLAMHWTLSEFLLSVAAPLLPAGASIWRAYVKQHDAVASSERVRNALETTWQKAKAGSIEPSILDVHARHIQDEIFSRRRTISRIPLWFYLLNRVKFQEQMHAAAAKLTEDAIAQLGIVKP